MQLHFCNFTGKIEAELAKNNGYKKWDVRTQILFPACFIDLYYKVCSFYGYFEISSNLLVNVASSVGILI